MTAEEREPLMEALYKASGREAKGRGHVVSLPAWIHGSEGVSAHFGTVSESNIKRTASFSLDF